MNKRKKMGYTYRARFTATQGRYAITRGGPMALCRLLVDLGLDPREVTVERRPRSGGAWCDVLRAELESCMSTVFGSMEKAERHLAYQALCGDKEKYLRLRSIIRKANTRGIRGTRA